MGAYKPRKITIRQNRYDNWYGYISGKLAAGFLSDPFATQQEKAESWKAEMERIEAARAAKTNTTTP